MSKIEISKTLMSDGCGDGWKAEDFEVTKKAAAFYERRIPEILAEEGREIEISVTPCRDSGYCAPMSVTEDGECCEDGIHFEVQAAFEKAWEEFCNLADEFGDIN